MQISLFLNCQTVSSQKSKQMESFLSSASAAYKANRSIHGSYYYGKSMGIATSTPESIEIFSSEDFLESVLDPIDSVSFSGSVAKRTLPIPDKTSFPEIISDSDDDKSTGDERIAKRARTILEAIDAINTSLSEGSDSDDEVIVPATPDLTPLTSVLTPDSYYDSPPPPLSRTVSVADLLGFTFPDRALTLMETVSLYEAILNGGMPANRIPSNLHRHQVLQFSLRWMTKYHTLFCLFWTPDGNDHGFIKLNQEYTTVFSDMIAKAKAKVGFGRTLTRQETRRVNNKCQKERIRVRNHAKCSSYYDVNDDSDDE